MKASQQSALRRKLEAIAARIGSDARAVNEQVRTPSGGAADGNLSNAPVHLGDSGTEEFLHDLNAVLLANEQYLVREAREALRRMDQGTFGVCESCGKSIARNRLQAMPYARYCVRCAEQNGGPPLADVNEGRPMRPIDTLAPEGDMDEDRRTRRRATMDARDRPRVTPDVHAAGTAGGGTAIGGLAGTNEGHGDPIISDLQQAAGSGEFDLRDDRPEEDEPQSGRSGGAVGGTPARKRTR